MLHAPAGPGRACGALRKKTWLVHALRFKERIDAEQELMALVAKKKAAKAAAEAQQKSR